MDLPHTSVLDRIKRWHAKALEDMLDAPEVALTTARKTAEAICKIVFHDEISKNGIPTDLDQLITQLKKGNFIPKKIALQLSSIQQHGNFGSHDQGDESDEIDAEFVESCIKSLDYVCKWLLEDYLDSEYPPEKIVRLRPPISVRQLAEALRLKPFVIIKNLMDLGIFLDQDGVVTADIAVRLSELHGWHFVKENTKSK